MRTPILILPRREKEEQIKLDQDSLTSIRTKRAKPDTSQHDSKQDSEEMKNKDQKKINVALTRPKKALEWIKWHQNSCRYEAFISVFSLRLFKRFSHFNVDHADKRMKKTHQLYLELHSLSNSILNTINMEERRKVISDFWQKAFDLKVDSYKPGIMEEVQELLAILEPLTDLRVFPRGVSILFILWLQEAH